MKTILEIVTERSTVEKLTMSDRLVLAQDNLEMMSEPMEPNQLHPADMVIGVGLLLSKMADDRKLKIGEYAQACWQYFTGAAPSVGVYEAVCGE